MILVLVTRSGYGVKGVDSLPRLLRMEYPNTTLNLLNYVQLISTVVDKRHHQSRSPPLIQGRPYVDLVPQCPLAHTQRDRSSSLVQVSSSTDSTHREIVLEALSSWDPSPGLKGLEEVGVRNFVPTGRSGRWTRQGTPGRESSWCESKCKTKAVEL